MMKEQAIKKAARRQRRNSGVDKCLRFEIVDEVRGRVRLHAVPEVDAGSGVDDDRRKSLAEKGWARCAVVVHSVGSTGAANLLEVPGRETYGSSQQDTMNWAADMVDFADNNFDDGGGEVRSVDQRDRKMGLFGDFCKRVGQRDKRNKSKK